MGLWLMVSVFKKRKFLSAATLAKKLSAGVADRTSQALVQALCSRTIRGFKSANSVVSVGYKEATLLEIVIREVNDLDGVCQCCHASVPFDLCKFSIA
jgi:hypothetical protein